MTGGVSVGGGGFVAVVVVDGAAAAAAAATEEVIAARIVGLDASIASPSLRCCYRVVESRRVGKSEAGV